MEVEIRIDPACRAPRVVILAPQMTGEIQALAQRLSQEAPQVLTGMRGDTLEVLEPADILRIYASAGKVLAATARGEYTLRARLYELEEGLDQTRFVRISHSEIINLKQVKGFDLQLTGTICVTLSDGTVTYVSRRYVAKLKKILGV